MSGAARKSISITQAAAEKSPYNAPEGYQLVWQDEFDSGSELNQNDWTHEVKGKGWVNNELQEYVNHKTPGGALVTEIKNGALRITALKENGKVYSGRVYAKVKEGWTYGYIEASIKLPKGKGTWPAFWMMPVNFKSWPADGEIDIMEEVGYHPDYVSSSLHANAHVHSNNTQVTHEMKCAGAEGEFHTYAILWTAKNITTYVDGKVQLSYDNRGLGRDDWPYDDPFYVIFNLAWGGDWGGSQGVDESALPCTMEVDYIRVFQKK
jgi:beta-glucanase (GH16 family)